MPNSIPSLPRQSTRLGKSKVDDTGSSSSSSSSNSSAMVADDSVRDGPDSDNGRTACHDSRLFERYIDAFV